MAFQYLVDWLTGKIVLVDVPGAAVTPPAGGLIPVFAGFIIIPQ